MMHAHLVFVTKYRGHVLNDLHLDTLENLFKGVCGDFECELVEFNGESDHVHLLVNFPPKVAVSRLVNSLKGVSSRKLKRYHPELAKPAHMKDALWSRSYFAGSVGGAPISVLKQYIEQQTRPG
jgi:putative transposase